LKSDLRVDLAGVLAGRVCLIGIGNEDLGDDAFGVELARRLTERGVRRVIAAGTAPEGWMGVVTSAGYDNVVLLDAVLCDAEPGSVILMNASEIEARFPQVSTHKISLGTLARLVEGQGARVWLLGTRPETAAPGRGLSAPVSGVVDRLTEVICDVLARHPARGTTTECVIQ
jgi:hydrogenase maturation protease